MAKATRTAEYGSTDGGSTFDIINNKNPKQLLSINIWSIDGPNGAINGISFRYRDEHGDVVEIPKAGDNLIGTWSGTKHPIAIAQGEYLTEISGFYGPSTCLNSLKISTTEVTYKQYGKYPNSGDTSFNIDVGNDSIVALFGHYDSTRVKGIGAYRAPQA
ncbi:unnamed protein product [Urochloa decumbens]|uniref:Jacalin-type lectin domain-containing protein n=1 Tax=Urochloa decumbens TaxID=240449 RepID=A0ABC9BS25_9POAL